MAQFHSVEITDVSKNTAECAVVTFRIPDSLKDSFRFRQGQHLTLKKEIDGEDVRRSYSLCSGPSEDLWRVAVKQIPQGIFSTYVNEKLQAGDVLEVMEPSGHFGVDVSTTPKNYAAFVAGSGITPVLSMIKAHLEAEPASTFSLFYLNRTAKSIIFKEEIEQLRNRYFGRLQIYYFLTREQRDIELFNGRFDPEKLGQIFRGLLPPEQVDEVFLCGPEEMIFTVKEALMEQGVPEQHVHYELFVTGLTEADKQRMAALEEQRLDGVDVTVVDGGKEFHFVMTDEHESILDGALAAGADLPFACKGGVCSTCKCKVTEGQVAMKINYALEDYEVAQQFVLSCQAIPTSDQVRVDFDV